MLQRRIKKCICGLLVLSLVTAAAATERSVPAAAAGTESSAPATEQTEEKKLELTNETLFEAEQIDGLYMVTKYNGTQADGETVVVPAAVNGKKVQGIGPAFYNNWSVRAVYLPSSIRVIGTNAFASCAVDKVGSYQYTAAGDWTVDVPITDTSGTEKPADVTAAPATGTETPLPGTEKPLSGTEKPAVATAVPESPAIEITNLTASDALPEELTKIEENAFHTAGNLKEITLPVSIQYIGSNAFINTGISDFTIPEGAEVEYIGKNLFGSNIKTISLNGHIIKIDERAFEATSNLDSVTVGANGIIDEISAYAFVNSGIHTFTIDGKVNRIGDRAFEGASNLLSFTVNEGGSISTLGNHVFYCSGVHEVTLRGSVSSIGEYAFASCSNVDQVTVQSDVPYTLGQYAFTDAGIHKVDFSDGLSVVDKGTFEGCGNLQTVKLPETLTHIGEDAFKNVSNITEITLNETATVDPSAFAGAGGATQQAIAATNNNSAKQAIGQPVAPQSTPVLTPTQTPAPTPVITPAPEKKITVPAVKLKKAKKKGKKVTLTWTKSKNASGYTIYKKVVKKGMKKKKIKKLKFKKVKNVSAKTLKIKLKLAKKSTTSFYIKAFAKTTQNGKKVTVYSKASNTKKVKA